MFALLFGRRIEAPPCQEAKSTGSGMPPPCPRHKMSLAPHPFINKEHPPTQRKEGKETTHTARPHHHGTGKMLLARKAAGRRVLRLPRAVAGLAPSRAFSTVEGLHLLPRTIRFCPDHSLVLHPQTGTSWPPRSSSESPPRSIGTLRRCLLRCCFVAHVRVKVRRTARTDHVSVCRISL